MERERQLLYFPKIQGLTGMWNLNFLVSCLFFLSGKSVLYIHVDPWFYYFPQITLWRAREDVEWPLKVRIPHPIAARPAVPVLLEHRRGNWGRALRTTRLQPRGVAGVQELELVQRPDFQNHDRMGISLKDILFQVIMWCFLFRKSIF